MGDSLQLNSSISVSYMGSPQGHGEGAAGQGFLGAGVKWLIQILSDLIFTTIQSMPVSTELQFIECGDPVAWGSCFDHAVTWNKDIEDKNTTVVIYEDLKENLTASIKQIAEFFGFSPAMEQVQAIAERDTFREVRVKAQEIYGAIGLILFCQGVFGDFKNLFTEALNQDDKF